MNPMSVIRTGRTPVAVLAARYYPTPSTILYLELAAVTLPWTRIEHWDMDGPEEYVRQMEECFDVRMMEVRRWKSDRARLLAEVVSRAVRPGK